MNETETNEFKDRVTINSVLAFTSYGLDTGSDANVQKILNKTFSFEEVKSARTTLWELCYEGYLPAMKNRQTTARRSEQQAIVGDIVEWLHILTELDKRVFRQINSFFRQIAFSATTLSVIHSFKGLSTTVFFF